MTGGKKNEKEIDAIIDYLHLRTNGYGWMFK